MIIKTRLSNKQQLASVIFFATLFLIYYLLTIQSNFVRNEQTKYSDAPWLYIDIKQKSYKKLHDYRNTALQKGYITDAEKQDVRAILHFKNQEYPARLRLKGDLIDHLVSNKWSYRIKLNSEQRIFGMREFSIHRPESRNMLWEYLINSAFEEHGLISHRYNLVQVKENGVNKGLYALEEHFNTELVENQRYPEGIIFKFDEALWWQSRLHKKELVANYEVAGAGDFYSTAVTFFGQNKLLKNPNFEKIIKTAQQRLEAFIRGELKTSDVFEIEDLANYYAIADLFGSTHGLSTNQQRYYLNPITFKFQIIPFDLNAGEELSTPLYNLQFEAPGSQGGSRSELLKKFFADPVLRNAYIKSLAKISDEKYLKNLIRKIKKSNSKTLQIIKHHYPKYDIDWKTLDRNAITIKNHLKPLKTFVAYQKDQELNIASIHAFPVEIKSINGSPQNIFFESRRAGITPQYQKINVSQPQTKILTVSYSIKGLSKVQKEEVIVSVTEDLIMPTVSSDNYLIEKFGFELQGNRYEPKRNLTQINQNLIFPKDKALVLKKGNVLDLVKGSSLTIQGPLFIEGTFEEPVIIRSSDRSRSGILIAHAKSRSKLQHARFLNLSSPYNKNIGWDLRGAVTFYESDVSIENSSFIENIKGDDYLNVVRAKYELSATIFNQVYADAIDTDFSQGIIANCEFRSIGNDGIDVSGSNVTLRDIKFSQIGDKALSVGEKSKVNAEKLQITAAEIAIAVKDQSTLNAKDITISQSKYGILAFQKKPQFGSAKATFSKLKNSSEIKTLIEIGSQIAIDDKIITGTESGLREEFY